MIKIKVVDLGMLYNFADDIFFHLYHLLPKKLFEFIIF